MLDVFFTIDVEIWCDGWSDIDAKFAGAFERYIHGGEGGYGLPYQLRVLRDHGLDAVCFVEPLFAGRFGVDPLAEIVSIVNESGHEVQLHLHTEWVDESREAMLAGVSRKRQHLRYFDRAEQTRLIGIGIDYLVRGGAPRPTAFRAGSFAFNADSIDAIAANDIRIDSSYNASTMGPSSGVCPGELVLEPRDLGPVLEVPMTVFADGFGLRHAQLTACSSREFEGLLWRALEHEFSAFVLLSHNFELLDSAMVRPDVVVLRRFHRLCEFFSRNRDVFRVRGFRNGPSLVSRAVGTRQLVSPRWKTGLRMAEQLWRRVHR